MLAALRVLLLFGPLIASPTANASGTKSPDVAERQFAVFMISRQDIEKLTTFPDHTMEITLKPEVAEQFAHCSADNIGKTVKICWIEYTGTPEHFWVNLSSYSTRKLTGAENIFWTRLYIRTAVKSGILRIINPHPSWSASQLLAGNVGN